MKNWKILFAGILAAGMLAGCSKETGTDPRPEPINPNDVAYMNVDISLPASAGTRAGVGEEQGQDYENTIKKLLLVLARTDGSYAAHGIVDNLTAVGKTTVTTTAKINRTEIQRFYGSDGKFAGTDANVRVFAICNPTTEMIDLMESLPDKDATWYDKIGTVASEGRNAGIWTEHYFLMTNAEINTKKFPQLFDEWRVKYSTETTPFNLSGANDNGGGIDNEGAIKVERVAARFDFKDGSPASTPEHTYDIGLGDDAGKLRVKLVRMALVNMNKTFYYMRRTSADGTDTGSKLGGIETSDNYVVSTESDFKQKSFANTTDDGLANIKALRDKFFFPLYDTDGKINDQTRLNWDNYSIASVLDNIEDKDEGWEATDKTGYRIWRYVTENTIPGDASNQRTGITTGVIFKGKLEVNSDDEHLAKLKAAVEGNYQLPKDVEGYTYKVDNTIYPILYLFQNQLYVGWNDEIRAFIQNDDHKQSELYLAATTKDETTSKSLDDLYQELVAANKASNGTKSAEVDAALSAFRKAATTAGFTLYQASNDAEADVAQNEGPGYYFYYYYWNRHNDNGLPGTMGKMEFGVVRNNVYKLAVTGISKLGHPRITDNDPDPENPDNPDEKGDVYLTVSVEVLPWTVRVNNVEF